MRAVAALIDTSFVVESGDLKNALSQGAGIGFGMGAGYASNPVTPAAFSPVPTLFRRRSAA
jgi:hypothetical protein